MIMVNFSQIHMYNENKFKTYIDINKKQYIVFRVQNWRRQKKHVFKQF